MLRISKVDAYYGSVRALHEVSLEVQKGSIVTLIGANGAGKSTLLKAIAGVVRPSSGEIYFEGARIDRVPSHVIVKNGIASCPEGRRIWPKMTVRENLEMGSYARKDKKEIEADLRRILEYFPILSERSTQLAGSLSGGEQQMLAVGRALMSRPKLMLLDEPSIGLSPILVEQIGEMIRAIHREGTTILLVEQNAFLALNLADWGYVLEVGKIILQGKGADLLQNDIVRQAYLGM